MELLNQTAPGLANDVLANVIAHIFLLLLMGLIAWLGTKLRTVAILSRFSLRTRITTGLVVTTILSMTAMWWFQSNAYYCMAISFISMLAIVQLLLSDLSRVGILNAFSTTTGGIRPEVSLKMVHTEMAFLGIGAKKLIDRPEFDSALQRCKNNGGAVKFLLSDPENPALERLAKGNSQEVSTYRSRVRESIKQIKYKADILGLSCEIKIYNLDNELALPHFRLMFIDRQFCLFSHLVWNPSEGWDNPQMILRKTKKQTQSSLYMGYEIYFNDLWKSDRARVVDDKLLDSWAS